MGTKKSILQEVLGEYPDFYDKTSGSVNRKIAGVLGKTNKRLKEQEYLISRDTDISRPLKIWREQLTPYNYTVHFEVDIPSIRRVQFYSEGTLSSPETPTLLMETEEFPMGVDSYKAWYNDSTGEVIPDKRYFVYVETWEDTEYVKGFPHTPINPDDKYELDHQLDVLGRDHGCPRRTYQEVTDQDDYPKTVPPYCTDEKEWDYSYEKRVIRHMEDYENLSLPVVELKRFFEITPQITGRWRKILRQNSSKQHTLEYILSYPDDPLVHYMESPEWNSAVFDISCALENIPKNIKIPDLEEVQNVVNRTMPLGKKAYFNLAIQRYIIDNLLGDTNTLPEQRNSHRYGIVEGVVPRRITLPWEKSGIVDTIKGKATSPPLKTMMGVTDNVRTGGINYPSNSHRMGIVDGVGRMVANIPAYYHDTNTDFALDTLVGCSISGSGAAAIVRLNPLDTSASDTPTGQSQGAASTGWPWLNPANAVDADGNTYAVSDASNYGVDMPLTKHTPDNPNVTISQEGSGRSWSYLSELKENVEAKSAFAAAGTGWSNWVKINFGNQFTSIPAYAKITGCTIFTNSVCGPTSGQYTLAVDISSSTSSAAVKTRTITTSSGGLYQWQGSLGGSTDLWGMSDDPADWKSNLTVWVRMNNTTSGTSGLAYVEITLHWTPDPYRCRNLNVTGVGFSVPVSTTVTGVRVSPKCWCETSDKSIYAVLTAGGVTKSKTISIPTASAGTVSAGGDGDMWGGLPPTPASYNSIGLYFYTTTVYQVRLYYVTVTVYYLRQDGTLDSTTITAPVDGFGWNKLETVQTVPGECGANAIRYDILKASDGSVLLGNRVPPVDLTGLAFEDLKLKAKLHSDNVAYYPSIDQLKLSYKKEYA